jgi:hypothetical protein
MSILEFGVEPFPEKTVAEFHPLLKNLSPLLRLESLD